MELTVKEVEHIAHLARLTLTEEERNRYQQQLSAILEHFVKLQEIDTTDIPQISNISSSQGLLREDMARESLPIEDLLRNAPESEVRQFKVPLILDEFEENEI